MAEEKSTRTVRITVTRAIDLKETDVFDKSDPYCLCDVLGAVRTTFQTEVVKNDLHPVWNHVQEVEWDGQGDIVFKVMDKDLFTSDDLIGHATLPAEVVAKGFDGQLTLERPEKRVGFISRSATNLLSTFGINPSAQVKCCSCFEAFVSLEEPKKGQRLVVKIETEGADGSGCVLQ
eukprot:TRINITY_DN57720_c0_g1_i1.p2 TRINITY_DN57720_c0_g1~~TRINITY_DN57720_c0_g1_i1.p2  ORF type:complete len:188 (-),score=45.06 TRINITY_DN57720_c0_g1_i1:218-745(-)